MHSLTKLHIFNLNKGFALRQITITTAHKLIVLALLITALLVVLMVAATSQSDEATSNSDGLGQHYVRLIQPAVNSLDLNEINRILASMVEDKQILRASVFAVNGQRLAQQGVSELLPRLIREDAQRTLFLMPISHNNEVIGYLQWVHVPNS